MYQRSADLGLGIPFNIASYAVLTHMMAHVTGTEPHELIMQLGDAHVYQDHVEALQVQCAREPRDFPTLTIKREVRGIDDFTYEDFEVIGYRPHPKIGMRTAPLSRIRSMLTCFSQRWQCRSRSRQALANGSACVAMHCIVCTCVCETEWFHLPNRHFYLDNSFSMPSLTAASWSRVPTTDRVSEPRRPPSVSTCAPEPRSVASPLPPRPMTRAIDD